jgi:hypothetical protein
MEVTGISVFAFLPLAAWNMNVKAVLIMAKEVTLKTGPKG